MYIEPQGYRFTGPVRIECKPENEINEALSCTGNPFSGLHQAELSRSDYDSNDKVPDDTDTKKRGEKKGRYWRSIDESDQPTSLQAFQQVRLLPSPAQSGFP